MKAKPWFVVCDKDGAWTTVEMFALGRQLVTITEFWATGIVEDHYDYTGLCPRQKVAFARFRESVFTPWR